MSSPKRTAPDRMLSPKQVGLQIGRHEVVVIRYANETPSRFPNAVVAGRGNGRRYGIPQSDVDRYLAALRISA